MKKIILLNGCLTTEFQTEITEEEFEKFNDLFIELVEQKGYCFGGGFSLLTEQECEEKLNKCHCKE